MAKSDKKPGGMSDRGRPTTGTKAGVPKHEERGHDIVPPPGQAEKGGGPGWSGDRRSGDRVIPPRRK
jgi:hypothetical protein